MNQIKIWILIKKDNSTIKIFNLLKDQVPLKLFYLLIFKNLIFGLNYFEYIYI